MTAPEQQGTRALSKGTSIRVGPEVWTKLLTLQYQRKLAGEQVSMSEIIEQLLNQSEAA